MTVIDDRLIDELLAQQLDIFRFEAGVRARVLAQLERLQAELIQRLRSADLTEYNKTRLRELLKQASTVIDNYYTRIQGELDIALRGIGNTQTTAAANALEDAASVVVRLDATLPARTYVERLASNTLIHGAVSADWWDRQSRDTTFRFATAVRQGLVQGETNEQIVARITGTPTAPGVMEISRHQARTLVHASAQAIANAARLETFRRNADVIVGVRQISTLDNKTSTICIAYSGQQWDLDGEPINGTTLPFNGGPPRHWNCRSILVPITKSFRELGVDIDEAREADRASMDGPLPASTTFDAFLRRKGKEFQDEVLGAGRAELWREKKITLQQLLDMRGNPLSLTQLTRKYARKKR